MKLNGNMSRFSRRSGLYLAAFLGDFSMGAGQFGAPLLAIALGASQLQLGLLGLSWVIYLLGCVAMGTLSDRWGRKQLPLLACLLLAITYPLLGVMPSFWSLLLLYCFAGAAMSLFWPPLMTWLTEQPENRSLLGSVGTYNVSWSIGLGLAPLVGGLLAKRSLLLPPALPLLAMPIVAGMLLLAGSGRHKTKQPEGWHTPRPLAPTFLFIGWIANFSLFFCVVLSGVFLPKVTTEMGISTVVLGAVLASLGIARTLMFVFAGLVPGWQYRLWPIVIALCGATAGMLAVFWSASPAIWVAGFVLLGLAVGLIYTSSLLYTLDLSSSRLGLRTGIHESLIGAGGVFGPLGGGLVAELTGNMKSPWLLAAAVPFLALLAAIILYALATTRLKRQQGSQSS